MGTDSVLYFGDDDNTYDYTLLNALPRDTKTISLFNVGLSAQWLLEGPVVRNKTVPEQNSFSSLLTAQ